MAKYAKGTKSKAISDISGFEVRYTQLRTTWDNLRVEPEEFDPKQPQLTPAKNVIDATALYNPRPNNDPENVVINIGFTQNIFASRIARSQTGSGVSTNGDVGIISISLEEAQTGVGANSGVGIASAGIVVSGNAGTFAIGNFAAEDQTDVSVSKATGTTAICDFQTGSVVSGNAGTGAIGSLTFNFDRVFELPNGGSVGTGGIGTSAPQTDVISTNIAGTGGINNATVGNEPLATGVQGTGGIGTFGESGNGQLNLNVSGIGAQGTANAGAEVAESEIPETNTNGFGENPFGYAEWGGDGEVKGTGVIGSSTIDIFVGPFPSGLAGTTDIGDYVVLGDLTTTGVVGTGGVGTVSLDSDVSVTGVAGTFAIGNEVISINGGYGEGTYGSQTWGN